MKVFLSETAANQISVIIEYLELKWSPKVRNNFIDKLQRSMDVIESLPYGFPASKKIPGIRKCVITPQTSAYYRINEAEQEVEIIAVLDNRQNFNF